MSLDGFIATENDDISWLNAMDKDGEDYGYHDFISTVDTYIIGRKTYDVVTKLLDGKFPQAQQFKCYVISREQRKPENGVTFYSGRIEELISQIRSTDGKDIYCDGGGEIVNLLMKEDLIDEYIVAIIPIILGNGKRLFLGNTPLLRIEAHPPKYFDTGLVQLRYIRK